MADGGADGMRGLHEPGGAVLDLLLLVSILPGPKTAPPAPRQQGVSRSSREGSDGAERL